MTNQTNSSVFCLTPGWSMRNGFGIAIGADAPCVMYLFPNWNADTPAKYAVCVIASFLSAVAIEAIAYLRRRFERKYLRSRDDGSVPPAEVFFYVGSLLYGIQLFFAYIVMLVVMLYETVMFIAVLVGFVCGHAFFSVYLLRTTRRAANQLDTESVAHLNSGAANVDEAVNADDVVTHSPCCGGSRFDK
jgi:hypothetical protein